MSHALITGAPHTSVGSTSACDGPGCDRELLLQAARQAGLEPNDVVRVAEVLTGRSWEDCGRSEIRFVARALLEALRRAASGHSEGARPCAG